VIDRLGGEFGEMEGVVFVKKAEREGEIERKLKNEEMGKEGERKLRRSQG